MKFLKLIPAVLLLAFVSSCSSDEPMEPANPLKPVALSRSESQIVDLQNDFAADFFSTIAGSAEDNNIVVSPLSMSMFLSTIANATQGDTQAEILKALGFEAADIETANLLNSRLIRELPAVDNTTVMSIANSLWLDNALNVKADFLNTCVSKYNAEIYTVDLPGSDARINSWISNATNGLIPAVSGLATYPGHALPVNAMYFKGRWTTPFSAALTAPATFNNADGSKTQTPMMHADGVACSAHYDTDGFHVVKLPYGNGAFSMVLILPDVDKSLDAIVAALDGEKIAKTNEYNTNASIDITLPKFKIIEQDESFTPILARLGINKVFSADADFTPLADGDMRLYDIAQYSVIEVDEVGTTAASVTTNTDIIAPGPAKEFKLVFDRPFAFYISEISTDAVIMMGRVSKL